MPKRIVNIKPAERKAVSSQVFHSYQHISSVIWQEKQAKRESWKRFCERVEETNIKLSLVKDVLHGRHEITSMIAYSAAELYGSRHLSRSDYEKMCELEESYRLRLEQKTAREEFLELYRYWDISHPPRKRKWWR